MKQWKKTNLKACLHNQVSKDLGVNIIADITLIIGNNGEGKTLLLVWKALNEIPNDYTIYSNFKLNLPNYKKLTLYEILHPPENKCVFFIDEISSWFESRTSGGVINREGGNQINFQKRKRYLDVYGTNPLASAIDKRFRFTANNFVLTGERSPRSKQDFIYYEYDKRNKQYQVKKLYYEYAEKHLFHLFNTDEIIDSYNTGLNEFKLARQNESLFKRVLIMKMKLVLASGMDVKEMTHDSLSDDLVNLEIHLNWEKYLYNRLKRQWKEKKNA